MSSLSPAASAGGWRRLTAALSRVLDALLALSVLVLIFPVSLQIFSRFTALIPSYIWTEEMARLLFVWMIMIGTMIAVREGTHFVVDIWPQLRPKPNAALNLVTQAASLVFALVFVWSGIEFTQFAWNRISELAELPLWIIHVAWPLTGVVWLLFSAEQIVDDLRTLAGSGA